MKPNVYASLGTSVSCILLFVLLWFYILPYSDYIQPTEEGIMISFGNSDEGGGLGDNPEVEPELARTPVSAQVNTAEKKPVQSEELISQSKDESLAILQDRKKKSELQRQQHEIENQRVESEKRVAEQKKKEQAAIERASALNGVFGNGGGNGSGRGTGDTYQGNPAGKGSYGGNSYNVNGRSLTGTLISPVYDRDVEGKITVNIKVDDSGRVIATSIGSPTTIADASTRKAAENAAKNTRFSAGTSVSSGSITYNFNLK